MKIHSAKSKTATSSLPKKCSFYVADDIRLEQGGKTSLLGFFPDNVVVIPLPKEVGEPSKAAPIAIPGLAFLANFPGSGSFDLEMELLAPGKVTLLKTRDGKIMTDKPNFNVLARLQPFPVVSFGVYALIVRLNKKPYRCQFEVRRGEPDSSVPQSLNLVPQNSLGSAKKAGKKKR